VIDDDETIGAAGRDYPAKQDINGTTAEIAAPPCEKPILNSFRVITPSRTVNIPAKRIRTPSMRVIASQFAAAIDCCNVIVGVRYGAKRQFAWRSGNRG